MSEMLNGLSVDSIKYQLSDDNITRVRYSSLGFNHSKAIAYLILANILFTGEGTLHADGVPDIGAVVMTIDCSDVFVWGCSDCDILESEEDLELLYNMYKKDPKHGSDVFCCIKRKLMPQPPVERKIREAGIWNLDEYDLQQNPSKKDK
jgi:hypothetical protein